VLAQLRHAGAPGLFFVNGEQAARYPDLVRDVVEEGHEVAVHGFRHQTRRQWPSHVFAADTRRAIEVLASLGVEPRFYRPPHGAFTLSALRSVRSLGLAPLLWSRWGRDWERRATAATIASHATAALRAGDVLLLHDADHYGASGSWKRTAEALPEIFGRIEAAGLEPASVEPGRGSRAPALTA
jgi:peptidoglycan/xylan/chitin deacetylase (PgdA/CDA1 family)